jgi:formylglycine-generating enzyme required for sulfatase activity
MTKTGTAMGTVWYMSPEQIRGKDVDERSDVYSLAMTLYEMLAGRLPFSKLNDESDFEVMSRIMTEEIPSPQEFYPSIPNWLVEIVMRGLKKTKADRIQNVNEFLTLLKNVYSPTNIERPETTKVELVYPSKILPSHYSEMIEIEGGWFEMGGNEGEINEKPVHKVYVDGFYISKFEVTQKQWRDITGNNPGAFQKCDDCPVDNVSWNDVQKFLNKLNSKTRRNYRLPTEAEWEFAARGGNKSRDFRFSGSNNVDEVAWYDNNSGSKTHPVGQKKPNELGIYDMSGNVWEWCSDRYDREYYNKSSEKNPQGPTGGRFYVLRGGSAASVDNYCRVAVRSWSDPDFRDNYGFRLVHNK